MTMCGHVLRPRPTRLVRIHNPMTRYDRFWEPTIVVIAALIILFVTR
jgi:hypothetical protein